MEKQKVMSQTTKQDKTTEKQLNELKIDNLPEKKKKKFRMIVMMSQDLRNTLDKM